MKSILLLGLFVFHNVFCANVRVDPLVKIDQGLVRGEKSADGTYSSFLGIPYAGVDLDDPFGPAQPAPQFNEIFNAYTGSIKCPQINRDGNDEGTLDCLRLNIYVPSQATSKNPLPVLVWIHGGGFGSRSAGEFIPSNLVKQGIIVVTINYRLGPYGFLCLDNPSVPGNQGIKDQYAALQWIKTNIGAFGGNPYEVTLGGESAGSASVLYHLYSPNDKLYNKIIIQSDTPQNEGMFVKKDVNAAIKIAENLGFSTTDTEQALEFLKNTSPNLVVAAAKEANLQLKPCKEQSFDGVDNIIESNPFSLSNQRKVRNTPVLIGHTSKEHMGVLLDMYGSDYLKGNPFYDKLKNNFNLDENVLNKAADIVKYFYVGDSSLSEAQLPVLEDFDSDFVFYHPVQRTVTNLLNDNAKAVYQYLFKYVGDSEADGAAHAAENDYLFYSSEIPRNEEDKLMIERMATLWTNFVKYGNPTPTVSELLPVTWEPTSIESRPYLVIDNDLRVDHRVFHDRMAFWDLFYAMFGDQNIYADSE
ncbi:esterase FE4-like [Pectinophora gossypiella]|uniref:esterase FE4-like n=1 Tax=Pectinophora gossypiella TaxID=13191 RepID=UPI00214F25C7|nr:esterase FE4-like [Pectinophora gossypiella]